MSWVRLDDGYPEHPKVDRVGPMAAWLNVCAWAYCARNLTDGFVPADRVPRLASVRQPAQLAAKLVAAKLWEAVEGGFQVHDYLSYNPSRAAVLKERADAVERMRSHRSSPEHKPNFARSSASPAPIRPGYVPNKSGSPPKPPPEIRCRECHEGVIYAPEGLELASDESELAGLCARCLIVAQQRAKTVART